MQSVCRKSHVHGILSATARASVLSAVIGTGAYTVCSTSNLRAMWGMPGLLLMSQWAAAQPFQPRSNVAMCDYSQIPLRGLPAPDSAQLETKDGLACREEGPRHMLSRTRWTQTIICT